MFSDQPDARKEIAALKQYLSAAYYDRFTSNRNGPDDLIRSLSYHVALWAETTDVYPLADFKGDTTYQFSRTPVSDVDSLALWQNLGFKMKQGMKRSLPGYASRLFIGKLRRSRELIETQVRVDRPVEMETHWVGKIALN